MRSYFVSISHLLLVVLLASFSSHCTRSKSVTVNVGYLPIAADLPLFIALDEGFFKDEGLDVKLIRMSSSNEEMNALMSGRIHIGGAVGFSSLLSIESKNPGQFKLYASGFETDSNFTAYLLIRKGSDIKSINDLEGKVVGTYLGLTQLLNLQLVLRNILGPGNDVRIAQVSTSLQVPALESGQFDALFTIDPYSTIALEKGIADVLMENPRVKYILSPFPTFGNPISPFFYDSYKPIAEKFILAYQKSLNYMVHNRMIIQDILPKYTPIERDIAGKIGNYEIFLFGDEDRISIQNLADILKSNGIIDTIPNIPSLFLKSKIYYE